MQRHPTIRRFVNEESRRRAAILVLAAVFLIVAVAFTAFVTDIGFISLQKARLQNAADASALGAAMDFPEGESAVRASVEAMLQLNDVDPSNPDIIVTPTFGKWDTNTRSFTASTFRDADALQVSVRDRRVPAFFGTALGHTHYEVDAQAIAGRGAGPPRDVIVVIDCSTSMGNTMGNGRTRIHNTRQAAMRLINSLTSQDRSALCVFSWRDRSRNTYQKTGTIERSLTFDHSLVRTRIESLTDGEYGSGTNIGGGLRAALDVFRSDVQPRTELERERLRRVVVLLTDGRVNEAEPYPTPNDGPTGIPPQAPYTTEYDRREAVRRWSNTLKARGIQLYVVTVSDEANDSLMAEVASPPDDDQQTYYYHVPDGSSDHLQLLQAFESIGTHGRQTKLVY